MSVLSDSRTKCSMSDWVRPKACTAFSVFKLTFSTFKDTAENTRWEKGGVVFATVSAPGSNNGFLMQNEARLEELDAGLRKSPNDPALWLERGEVRIELGDAAGATKDASETVRLDPTRTGAYILRGRAHYLLGRLDEATADFCRAIELDPADPKAYEHRGVVHAARGDFDRALEDSDAGRGMDAWEYLKQRLWEREAI